MRMEGTHRKWDDLMARYHMRQPANDGINNLSQQYFQNLPERRIPENLATILLSMIQR